MNKLNFKITFKPINYNHYRLLYNWLNKKHVKEYWHSQTTLSFKTLKFKYRTYIRNFKLETNIKKPIYAYIIYANNTPIGYIQYYNAYDFSRDGYELKKMPTSLAAIDIFIGNENFLKKGIASKALKLFLKIHLKHKYNYVLIDTDINNHNAIKFFKNIGFKIKSIKANKVIMLYYF